MHNPEGAAAMADDQNTPAVPVTETASSTESPSNAEVQPSSEIPKEVQAALRKANKEAETLRLKLKEFEDKDKTEAERAASRMVELEREAQAARSEALRYRIATRHGISDEDAELYLTAADEETLDRQAKGLAARNAAAAASTAPAGPRPDLSQGARDIPLNGDPIEARLKHALGIT